MVLRLRWPEQDLDGPQVGAVLEQVGGEAVSEGVHGDVLVQPDGAARRPADLAARLPEVIGRSGRRSGEEAVAGPDGLPVVAEDLQQPRREHDVAILLPLALADADDHALAVDVVDAQGGRPRRSAGRRRRRS